MRFIPCLLCALIGLAPAAAPASPYGDPYTPASADEVLEQLPPRGGPSGHLRLMQQELAQHSGQLEPSLAFARAAIEAGRAEQDPRDFGYAESALATWWNRADAPEQVVLLRAVIKQWRHDFDGATRDLDMLISRDGDTATQARLVRASLRLVTGEPLDALRDCVALMGHTEVLTAATCIANANSLRGRGQTSLDSLCAVLDQSASATPPLRLWAMTSAAEMADRLGRNDQARKLYQQALAAMDAFGVPDPYLLASAADFMVRNGEARAVVKRLAPLARIDNLLLRLALAESDLVRRGDAAAAQELAAQVQMLDDRFTEAAQRQDSAVHLREQAWFELELRHRPDRALELAARNWTRQREPLDARILLAAALAARRLDAAAPVRRWMAVTGVEDVHLQALLRQLDGGGSS